MALDAKSLTELRGIAQAVGVKFGWGDTKAQLLAKINANVNPKVEPPPRISDEPIPTQATEGLVTQAELSDALHTQKEKGLVLTFPTEGTWHIRCDKRQDSGSLRMPLRVIVDCARVVLHG